MKNFQRSPLLVVISMLLCSSAWADNIVPTDNATQISQKNGVDIVRIARPNAQGLSHNRYHQFNVSQQGAVLNNATAAGRSQLAGRLGANANLGGRHAKVILNEVVDANPSKLLGKQEVFGKKADYVLANPSGITCDGCGFINTSRASLVVGKPQVEKGQLTHFDLDHKGKAVLRHQVKGAQVLDVVAPQLDVNADVSAQKSINLVAGQGRVNYRDLSVKGGAKNEVLDSQILGSMHAGAIRVHLHNAGAHNVVSAELKAQNQVEINDAGSTALNGVNVKAQKVAIHAQNLYLNGQEVREEVEAPDVKTDLGNQVTHTKSHSHRSAHLKAATIAAKEVRLGAEQTHELRGVNIDADSLFIDGGDVRLGSVVTTDGDKTIDKDSKQLWFNSIESDHSAQRVYVDHFKVKKNLQLNAKNALSVEAADLAASSLSLAGKDITIAGKVSEDVAATIKRRQNETAKLITGTNSDETHNQHYQAAALTGDKITINGQDVALKGAQVNATAAAKIHADNVLEVAPETTESFQKHDEHFTYWGGIGGGEKHRSENLSRDTQKSVITAGQLELSGKNGVKIAAGQVISERGLAVQNAQGTVAIENGESHQISSKFDQKSGAFSIPVETHDVSRDQGTAELSALNSHSTVKVNADNVTLKGAQVHGEQVVINAKGNVNSDIAENKTLSQSHDYQGGPTGYINLNGKNLDLKAKAGVRWDNSVTNTQTTTSQAEKTVLAGRDVAVNAKGDVALKGTEVSGEESVSIHGKNVTVGAADHLASANSEHQNTSSVDFSVTATPKKLEGAVDVDVAQKNHETATHEAVGSTVQAGLNLDLNAQNTLKNQGSSLQSSEGTVTLSGKTIVNEAASTVQSERNVEGKGHLGVTVYGKAAPNVGGTVALSGEGSGTTTVDSQSQATTISGSQVRVRGQEVSDTGTRYHAGDLNIKAQQYQSQAAENQHVSTTNEGGASVNLEAFTTTGQDVSIDVGASGNFKRSEEGKATAQKGFLKADNLVISAQDIAAAADISADHVTLSGDNIALNQSNNRDWKKVGGAELGGELGVDMSAPGDAAQFPKAAVNAGLEVFDGHNAQAVNNELNAKDLTIRAKNSAVVVGNDLNAEHLAITGAQTTIAAGQDQHRAVGVTLKGNVNLSLDTDKEPGKVSDADIGGTFAVTNENNHQAAIARIQSGNVAIAGTRGDVTLEGLDLKANKATVTAFGNTRFVAAQNEVHRGNFSTEGHINGLLSMKDSLDLGGKFDIDSENSHTFHQGSLKAQHLALKSGRDLTLQGVISSQDLNAAAQGIVAVKATQDHRRIFQTGAELNLSGSPVKFDENTTVKDVVQALKDDYNNDTTLGMSVDGNAHLLLDNEDETEQSQVKGHGKLYSKSGVVAVNASEIQGVSTGGAQVVTSSNQDFRHYVSAKVEGHNPHLKEIVSDAKQGKFTLPVKAEGKLDWQQPHVVSAKIN